MRHWSRTSIKNSATPPHSSKNSDTEPGLQGDRSSAGTKPAGLNPMAVAVMREAGIDISGQRSKHVDELAKQDFLYVITVCDAAREACPVFPGALYQLHWSFDDPAAAAGTEGARLAVFRRVRDEIGNQVREFAGREGFLPG